TAPGSAPAAGGGAFTPGCTASMLLIETSSTSKISVEFGAIPPPAPRGPYARSAGTNSCHFDPTGINCSASVQPLITPLTGNVAGCPRLYELSNSVPLISVPR